MGPRCNGIYTLKIYFSSFLSGIIVGYIVGLTNPVILGDIIYVRWNSWGRPRKDTGYTCVFSRSTSRLLEVDLRNSWGRPRKFLRSIHRLHTSMWLTVYYSMWLTGSWIHSKVFSYFRTDGVLNDYIVVEFSPSKNPSKKIISTPSFICILDQEMHLKPILKILELLEIIKK